MNEKPLEPGAAVHSFWEYLRKTLAKTPATSRKRKASLPTLIQKYYADLHELAHQNVFTEMGMRNAFHTLLQSAGREHSWTLIAEHEKKVNGRTIRPDGTFSAAVDCSRKKTAAYTIHSGTRKQWVPPFRRRRVKQGERIIRTLMIENNRERAISESARVIR